MDAKDTAVKEFQCSLSEYRKQLAMGTIRTAYTGLMGYLHGLRLFFENKYPDFFVSSSVQQGLMDYSYFYFFPKTLKQRKLKIVLLFVHDSFRFEVWLAGYNKKVQAKIWQQFKDANYSKYTVPLSLSGVDSIVEHVLVENADFSNPEALTKQIEKGALTFISDIEDFLAKK
ncbi:MAG: DUF7000 family protein [Candidatus Bathyarchaeia archaeon]